MNAVLAGLEEADGLDARACASFIGTSAGAFIATVVDFFALWTLFARFRLLEGWRFGEVALLYGVISVAFALADMVTRGSDQPDAKNHYRQSQDDCACVDQADQSVWSGRSRRGDR